MSIPSNPISQKEYLKKYLSGDVKDEKRKKKKKSNKSSGVIKRSKIIDDDIDLNSMRPLGDDELELYQMDEDAPQIAGIIDERPDEVKAQEYYDSKRWKVFGGEDGVNVVDSMVKNQQNSSGKTEHDEDFIVNKKGTKNEKMSNKSSLTDSVNSPLKNGKDHTELSRRQETQNTVFNKTKYPETNKVQPSHNNDSDLSPPRNERKAKKNYDSDHSPPRRDKSSKHNRDHRETVAGLPTKNSNTETEKQNLSPSRKEKKKTRYRSDSDNSPPRRGNRSGYASDSDNSPPRISKKSLHKHSSNSDNSPPRMKKRSERQRGKHSNKPAKGKNNTSSDSDNSPPRNNEKRFTNHRNNSPSRVTRDHFSRDTSPPTKRFSSSNLLPSDKSRKNISPRLSRKDLMYQKNVKRHFSDSDDSPPRRKTSFRNSGSSSDLSPPRKGNDKKMQKKKLYLPNDSSSSEGKSRSKSKKMKTTLDGKQAGLQDAKQLRKELSDLKMKEDLMFSKMDASVSGAGAAAIKRDRKTGQIRDLEKEKEIQKEKEAKVSVVNEKYSKWGRGLKQVEDAKERAAEALKEMNKPLARYVDDEDLDNFLKAQEREGDPMLDYIKQKQKESTALAGEKPIYQGSFNPNRFGIRPGHRWDGVVRSNGFEKEWFTHQNARKARDEEAYKWSTSDM